jgi:hypothetical protein
MDSGTRQGLKIGRIIDNAFGHRIGVKPEAVVLAGRFRQLISTSAALVARGLATTPFGRDAEAVCCLAEAHAVLSLLSKSPSVSASAFLHSIMVRRSCARSSLTIFAVIAIAIFNSP